MTDEQTRIDAEPEPLTWDGQPLYAPESVRESLFDPTAFEQMAGQMPFNDGCPIHCRDSRCGRGCDH